MAMRRHKKVSFIIYFQLVVKYHPDKNKSHLASDAFKKISHCFNVLNDDEKKDFYDKYGPEEELKKKMHQQQANNNYYYQDEPDPFDLFEMFFNGGGGQFEFRNGNLYRRQRNHQQNHHNRRRDVNQPQGIKMVIYQLLPFILFMLIYILPIIFQSSPVYQFEKSKEFFIKKSTSNGAVFFANEKFNGKYNYSKMSYDEKENLFQEIDYQYLEFLKEKCGKIMRSKQDLQYKIYYYQGYPKYVNYFQNEINKLDFSYCNEYNSFSQIVRQIIKQK